MIDVSTDALDRIIREPTISHTKMSPHVEEIKTRIPAPNRHNISCAAIFTPPVRSPADMLEEMT